MCPCERVTLFSTKKMVLSMILLLKQSFKPKMMDEGDVSGPPNVLSVRMVVPDLRIDMWCPNS